VEVGFFGKLPSHGDFLRRRTSDAFVGAWDSWLQECIAASRLSLGGRWLDVYLTSPAWRFVCGPGACGPAPILGIMAPSVDRVGRYFPLTLVAELPSDTSVVAAATETARFFESAERLVIDTLAAEHIDFERFDASVIRLADDLRAVHAPRGVVLDAAAAAILNGDGQTCWQMPIGSPKQLATVFAQLLSQRLSALYDPLVMWWTEGSANVEPSCLIAKGLPHPDTFGALLDGSWPRYWWQPVAAQVHQASHDESIIDGAALRLRSAAATDVGRVRETNQDAFAERPEIGLWAVADGLGGHRDGDVASRMVCDALADFEPQPSFDATIEAVRQRMSEVNEHLLRTSTRSLMSDRSASTVAVLLVRGSRGSILWAGDSRVYRWRSGRLEQVTRDHSTGAGTSGGREESHGVTRAVGVEPTLTLDLYEDQVIAGDRFLLCSDGLTRTVPDADIRLWIDNDDLAAAVDGLIRAALKAGAPDNVTVVIAEACSDEPSGPPAEPIRL
jgi:type VI secretion system protein ImpM